MNIIIYIGTLLNKLFNTKFQIMNEESRQQTTKGIWISQAENSNLLILDVEGTDGRERGEEQVNLWQYDYIYLNIKIYDIYMSINIKYYFGCINKILIIYFHFFFI